MASWRGWLGTGLQFSVMFNRLYEQNFKNLLPSQILISKWNLFMQLSGYLLPTLAS